MQERVANKSIAERAGVAYMIDQQPSRASRTAELLVEVLGRELLGIVQSAKLPSFTFRDLVDRSKLSGEVVREVLEKLEQRREVAVVDRDQYGDKHYTLLKR